MRVSPIFHLTHGLDDASRDRTINPARYGDKTWWTYATDRWSRLTWSQTHAASHHLEYRAWCCDLDRGSISQALAAYWYFRNASRVV